MCMEMISKISTNPDGLVLSCGVYCIKEVSASQGYDVYPVDCYT